MSSKAVNEQLRDAATVELPEPGSPGTPMASEFAKELHRNKAYQESKIFTSEAEAQKEIERQSGKKIEDMTEQDFAKVNVTLVAKDQNLRSDLTVVLKDKSMEPRWVNWKAGEGRSVDRHMSLGFRLVTKADIEYCMVNKFDDSTGALKSYDVVCMMAPKILIHAGLYKKNTDRAKAKVLTQTAQSDIPGYSPSVAITGGGAYQYQN